METTIQETRPAIYVGTYRKYNEGSIAGKWFDLTAFGAYSEFLSACKALHDDEEDPEYMIQDFEGFPEIFYSESGLPTEGIFDKNAGSEGFERIFYSTSFFGISARHIAKLRIYSNQRMKPAVEI